MKQNMPGGTSAVVPPDPMPNSEVKRRSADGSVGSPHARVGNCQALIKSNNPQRKLGVFAFMEYGKSLFEHGNAPQVRNMRPNRRERFGTALALAPVGRVSG